MSPSPRSRIAVALLAWLPLACTDATSPLPPHSERIAPPAEYRTWWKMTEACSGLQEDFPAVQWYVVRGTDRFKLGKQTVSGEWSPDGYRIIISEGALHVGSLVRHEMLHALLRGGGHPRSAFFGSCGGVVVCVAACAADAGPGAPPSPGARHIAQGDLEYSVDARAATARSAADSGFFTITISAHNPFAHEVIVDSPSWPGDYSDTFHLGIDYDVADGTAGLGRGGYDEDARASIYEAGETKRQVYDFVIGDRVESLPDIAVLAPGTYRVGAYYADNILHGLTTIVIR